MAGSAEPMHGNVFGLWCSLQGFVRESIPCFPSCEVSLIYHHSVVFISKKQNAQGPTISHTLSSRTRSPELFMEHLNLEDMLVAKPKTQKPKDPQTRSSMDRML